MPTLSYWLGLLLDYAKNHFDKILTGLILGAIGWYVGFRRAKANWDKREFFHRLNVSLNYIEDGTLMIRTLSEKPCADIFLNQAASETIQKSARQTTAGDPLLPLPKDDYWYYLNSILNELSEQYSVGALRKEQGLPVRSERYVLCLTSETAGEIRMRKIRAMVIRKSLLQNLLTETMPQQRTLQESPHVKPLSTPKFSSPNHATRWETLKFMAVEYQRNPWRFIEVELCT